MDVEEVRGGGRMGRQGEKGGKEKRKEWKG